MAKIKKLKGGMKKTHVDARSTSKSDLKRLARQIATGAGLSAALMFGACNGGNPMSNNDITNGPTQHEIDDFLGKDTTKTPVTVNEGDDRSPVTIDYPEETNPITIDEPEEIDLDGEPTQSTNGTVVNVTNEPTTETEEPTVWGDENEGDRNPLEIDDEPTQSITEAPTTTPTSTQTPKDEDERNPLTIDY